MFSLDSFYKQYETEVAEINVAGRMFRILLPKYLHVFINPQDALENFPLWPKLWKASWILAGYLAEKPVEKNKAFLEIGAGLGLVSIVAWCFGHRITMTENNLDALQFAHDRGVVHRGHAHGCRRGGRRPGAMDGIGRPHRRGVPGGR